MQVHGQILLQQIQKLFVNVVFLQKVFVVLEGDFFILFGQFLNFISHFNSLLFVLLYFLSQLNKLLLLLEKISLKTLIEFDDLLSQYFLTLFRP